MEPNELTDLNTELLDLEPKETTAINNKASPKKPSQTTKVDSKKTSAKPSEATKISTKKQSTKPKKTTKIIAKKVSKRPKKTAKLPNHKKIKLGSVFVFVEEESWSDEVNLPEHPVEKGLSITDHVQQLPDTLTLTGTMFKDSYLSVGEKLSKLRQYQKKGTRLTYSGRRGGRNLAIQRIDERSTGEIANGREFTITLKQIRIISKYKKKKKKRTNKKGSGGRKQTTNRKNPKYHIIKKGDTYIGLGKKYGIAWRTLYKLNKYNIYRLPIGKKMKLR